MKRIFELSDSKPVMCSIKKIDNIIEHPNAYRSELVDQENEHIVILKSISEEYLMGDNTDFH